MDSMEMAQLLGPQTTPIGELRRNRFQDISEPMQRIASYLEQLASQTGTNIDAWTLAPFEGLSHEDKRGINRVFFAGKDAATVGVDKISVEVEAALAEARVKVEETQKQRIADLLANRDNNLRAAQEASGTVNRYLSHGWNAQKEVYALQEKGATYITDDLKRLLLEDFWEFESYANSIISITTKRDVVMSEKNPSAGIDRRVNLGKYLAQFHVKTASLLVYRYKQNAVAAGHYHPYLHFNGSICWGNAATTANDFLIKGKLYEVLNLLASLLVTYSPTATPYVRLLEFHALKTRVDAGQSFSEIGDPEPDDDYEQCDICEGNREECDCCRECERTVDDCSCCSICDGTNNEECGCCHDCGTERDECTACRICDSHGDECDCCKECERSGWQLGRRGHQLDCSSYVIPEPIIEEPAEPLVADDNSTIPNEDALPF